MTIITIVKPLKEHVKMPVRESFDMAPTSKSSLAGDYNYRYYIITLYYLLVKK